MGMNRRLGLIVITTRYGRFSVYSEHSFDKISLKLAVIICRRIFPALANATNVGFYAMDLAINEGYPVEVFEEAWKDVTASVKKMVVVDRSSKLVDLQVCEVRPDNRQGTSFRVFLGHLTGIIP